MRISAVTLAAILVLGCAAPARAHGVRTEVAVGSMTVVTFTHEDGSPLAHTPFTVLAPRHTQPFLSGTTDRRGRVVFLPDEVGDWKVRVAGADGHGAVITVAVDSTALAMTSQEPAVVYAHEHEQLEIDAVDHGHAHGASSDHDHAHGPGLGEPAKAAAGDRWFSAAAGFAVLGVVLIVAVLAMRRRRG